MLGHERGTGSGSDLYFQTPSENARRFLYYMTSCGYYYTDYDYQIERGDYKSYLIFYMLEGRLSVQSNGKTMVAEPGQVGFVNCHDPHEYHTIGNAEFVWLHVDGAHTRHFYEQVVSQQKGFVFNLSYAEEIRKRLFEILQACRNEQLPGDARLSYMLYGVLTALLDQNPVTLEKDRSDAPILAAVAFIKAHYDEAITLADIAATAHMSQYYFSRQFKKACGYSPHEYLIMTRINRAKHLLKTTSQPVKVVAQSVGYNNITTFTNTFTARVGLSPSAFRKYPV